MLLVALAIVLLLAVRAWSGGAADAARALDRGPATARDVGDGDGDVAAPGGIERGALPDLNDMRDGTDAHADAVRDALEQIP